MMEPQRIDPETPLSVTMPAREWERVLQVLHKAPYEVVAQAINAIVGQCVNANNPPQPG
jgi:hypothetical protein